MPELPVFHFLDVILYILPHSWYQRVQQGRVSCTLCQKNRVMVKQKGAQPAGKRAPASAAAQGEGLQVCDKEWGEPKRDGWAPKGSDLDAKISCSGFARSSMQVLQREG